MTVCRMSSAVCASPRLSTRVVFTSWSGPSPASMKRFVVRATSRSISP